MLTMPARALMFCSAVLLLASCEAQEARPTGDPAVDGGPRTFAILHVNDVYRIDGLRLADRGGPARVRSLRTELERTFPDLLLMHGGDVFFPSFLSRSYSGQQMIDALNLLDGDADMDDRMFVVFGNHEFDRDGPAGLDIVRRRVAQSRFTWLDTNIGWMQADGADVVDGENVVASRLVESGGVKVGVFGLSLPLPPCVVADDGRTSGDACGIVSEIADPATTARRLTTELRSQGAEVVIAVTHLNWADDVELLETLGNDGPDFIVGGHDHTESLHQVGRRFVAKADADALSANVVTVTVMTDGTIEGTRELRALDGSVERDPVVQASVDAWLAAHDHWFCSTEVDPPESPGCLSTGVGRTGAGGLQAEESKIRAVEATGGNWVADLLVSEFEGEGAQAAIINAGALRLNQDVPADVEVPRRVVEELFGFPMAPVLVEITGRQLKDYLTRSVAYWPGDGMWNQVSGIAFRHDARTRAVDELTALWEAIPRPIADGETIRLATIAYLAEGAGFDDTVVEGPRDLKEAAYAALAEAGETGISSPVVGRICQGDGPCLAVSP